MALTIPVTWSESHRLHAPETAVWVGVPIEADELPVRADRIRAELEDAGAPVVDAVHHDDDALLAVHDAGLVDFLRVAWDDWQEADLARESGPPDVVGYTGVDRLVASASEHGSTALVLALGVDAGVDDPNAPLAVSADGFLEAGGRLGALGLPTVVVQEGGYVLDSVGPLVRAALEGLERGRWA